MIQPAYFTLAILMMAVITFTVRYLFFSNSIEIKINDKIKTILSFTAPCILTAMLVPIAFKDVVALNTSMALLSSSYFWASLCAVVLSLLLRNTLLVIVLSLLIFYGLNYFVFN